jgi:hypothetical protein
MSYGMSDGGKGSKPRPFAVPDEVFDENMTRIFGDKSEEKARKQREKDEYFAKLNAETKARLSEREDKLTRNNEETQEVLKGL